MLRKFTRVKGNPCISLFLLLNNGLDLEYTISTEGLEVERISFQKKTKDVFPQPITQ